MTKKLLILVLNYLFIFQTCHAQYRGLPNTPNRPAIPPTFGPNSPPPLGQMAPKCYPETATAYFLPAPPSSPKITVLNPNVKDINKKELPPNPIPTQNNKSNRMSFPGLSPPPPCLGLPDLIDEIPSLIQDRFSRLAESDEKNIVCESCASCIKKLPIFNFDQELLDGFLTGIGLISE